MIITEAMTTGILMKSRAAKWMAGFCFWTLLGLSFASQFYISSAKAGLSVTWMQAISFALGDWYVFAILSIPVIPLARRFHFEAGKTMHSLTVHAFGSLLFSLAYMGLRALVGQWQSAASFGEAFRPLLVKTWHFNLLIYWVIVAVSQAFQYYQRYREREIRNVELEKGLAQAKLQALQMQLNPHFLFNTLHSISSLMHKDVEAADRMVMRLGDLLRATLEGADTQEVTLRQELEFLERYLEIEKIRFGNRLTIKKQVDAEVIEALLPNLILQPLVENAIRHGIEPWSKPGCVELSARKDDNRLSLMVADNGAGLRGPDPPEEGVGLSNTRARLHALYGKDHTFELRQGTNGGLLVQLSIPLRKAESEHEDSNHNRG